MTYGTDVRRSIGALAALGLSAIICGCAGGQTPSSIPSVQNAGASRMALAVNAEPPPAIVEYSAGITAGSGPAGIVQGADGALWFTERNANQIGRITVTGTVKEFAPPGLPANSSPHNIAIFPNFSYPIWFTTTAGIAEMTANGKSLILGCGSSPNDLVLGSNGNMWFTDEAANKIGEESPTFPCTEFSAGITANAAPHDIAAGPDGNLWFTEAQANQIGRISTSGSVTEFSAGITAGAGVRDITAGPDGNLWFTENTVNKVGRITPSGSVTEFPSSITGPGSIAASEGHLWYIASTGNQIAEMSTSGRVVKILTITGNFGGNSDIAPTAKGDLWFTEFSSNVIGRIKV